MQGDDCISGEALNCMPLLMWKSYSFVPLLCLLESNEWNYVLGTYASEVKMDLKSCITNRKT